MTAGGSTTGLPLASTCAQSGGAPSELDLLDTVSPNLFGDTGFAATPDDGGYWTTTGNGLTYSYGDAYQWGQVYIANVSSAPIVGVARNPSHGLWIASSDGGVFAGTLGSYLVGTAPFYGSMGGRHLNAPVVGISSTPDGGGYWLVAKDGGVFAFGDAGFFGSMASQHLNGPIVGLVPSADGLGYWLVAADGGVFAFGDAPFLGSMGGHPLNAPVVGIAAGPSGGYWLAAADGGVFAFGTAFYGSMAGTHLSARIIGIGATTDGGGYWLAGQDYGIFSFGDAPFFGARLNPGPFPTSGRF